MFLKKRFLPLFVTQSLGALNDNLFRAALVTLITYHAVDVSEGSRELMVSMALGLFMAPYFLFSSLAGRVADTFDKAVLMRCVKGFEFFIAILCAIGFSTQNYFFLMGVLFLMGLQSTLFSPLKYSILPEHLGKNELLKGNGFIEAGTFISILIGTIIGGALVSSEAASSTQISVAIAAFALMGLAASFFIPSSKVATKKRPLTFRLFSDNIMLVRDTIKMPKIFLAILGISWFWFVGGVFLAQMPSFAKSILHVDQQTFLVLLMIFSIGIGAGSIACSLLLKNEVSTKYVPISALLMTGFIIDISYVTDYLYAVKPLFESGVSEFLFSSHGSRVAMDLFFIAFLGGLYVVPLNAYIQSTAEPKKRAQIFAANNIMNAIFIVVSSLISMVVLAFGFDISGIFWVLAIMQVGVAIYICRLLPHHLVRGLMMLIFKRLYGFDVTGMENYEKLKGNALIVANHTSFLDAVMLMTVFPENLTFAANTHTAKKWWIKPFLTLGNVYPIDPTNPMSLKGLVKEIEKGNKVVIFPEGRLTVTGALMKVYQGPGLLADKTKASFLPVRIKGAQYTPFSRMKGKVKIKMFPKLGIDILPPRKIDIPDEVTGRERREKIDDSLYGLMTDLMFESSSIEKSLFLSLMEAKKIHGAKKIVAEDVRRTPMAYGELVTKSVAIGQWLKRCSDESETIGLMLPNMNGSLGVLFGFLYAGRPAAMLNFSTGSQAILDACQTANIQQVITSREFLEKAKKLNLLEELAEQSIKVCFVEDIPDFITLRDKMTAIAISVMPMRLLNWLFENKGADQSAVVLFTSGSEGKPKGVMLSHKNIQANRHQVASRIDFSGNDVVFNALPLFHSFGLITATLLPVLSGVKVFFYPSPLHYRYVAELAYDTNATILFGTDTFLAGYGEAAHAYDFYSIRYVFAGAEKLKDATSQLWMDRFGVRIFEGYGATETSPVLSLNTPMKCLKGSVGQLLPGIQARLEDVPGIDIGKRLFVKGPNIMKGYLLHEAPGKLKPLKGGWYDTGDIVEIDEHDFIHIQGRAKRFAKIAGEMISLSAVEVLLQTMNENEEYAIIAVPDDRKGEKLVLFTTATKLTSVECIAFAKSQGFSELMVPKEIVHLEDLPLLGSGKIDYVALKQAALLAA